MRPVLPVAPVKLVETYEGLKRRSTPQSAGIPEVTPHWLFDTQELTDNSTTELTFFADTQNDRSLGNLGAGGSLPDPQFFTIFGIFCDVYGDSQTAYVTTAAGGVAGALDDMGILTLQQRPRFTLRISGKEYGPWPLTICHGTGGPTGGGWGTFTAEESLQWANNGTFGNGAAINGYLTIPPRADFSIVLTWTGAPNVTQNYQFRFVLEGLLYRAVK